MFAESYAKFYDVFNSKKPYRREVELVYRLAGKPRTIFDIGCGTASYWKHYPKSVELFGIDNSIAMVSEARRNGIGKLYYGDVTKLFEWDRESHFDCATALFDVLNYIPEHSWWKYIPVKKGGFFVFDIWNTQKIKKEGFRPTLKKFKGATRRITPIEVNDHFVDLIIDVLSDIRITQEKHRMYLYSHEDIVKFCGRQFEIVDVIRTQNWQTWYKCKRK